MRIRRTLLAALAAGLPLLAGAATTPAAATFPGNTGSIAFFSESGGLNGTRDIWIFDGNNYVDLTAGTPNRDDVYPSYSADGSHIAWIRDYDVWVMDSDGSNPTRLTRSGNISDTPTFTPDGHIIYRNRTGLQMMTITGDNRQPLNIDGIAASVSPNGNWVAYMHYKSAVGVYHVYRAHLDGTRATDLTPRSRSNQTETPDWAPNGRRIIYDTIVGTTSKLVTMRPDGTHKSVLQTADATTEILGEAKYSPDMFEIAYIDYVLSDGSYHLVLRSIGFDDLSESTTDKGPAWQPL